MINKEKGQWLDPTISWGHILTTVALIGTLTMGWSDVNSRLTLVEAENNHNRELLDRQQIQSGKDRDNLTETIQNMSKKLDRLIERLSDFKNEQ